MGNFVSCAQPVCSHAVRHHPHKKGVPKDRTQNALGTRAGLDLSRAQDARAGIKWVFRPFRLRGRDFRSGAGRVGERDFMRQGTAPTVPQKAAR